jgi:hypothetical protein
MIDYSNTTSKYDSNRNQKYSIVISAIISLLAGATLTFLLIVLQTIYSLPDSTANTLSSGNPQSFDLSGIGRVISYEYTDPDARALVPDPRVVDPSIIKQLDDVTARPVAIDLPSYVATTNVSQSFTQLMNAILALEAHMSGVFIKSMVDVHLRAAEGNYVEMFSAMSTARTSNQRVRELSSDVTLAVTAFEEETNNTNLSNNARNVYSELVVDTKRYAALAIDTADAADATLHGGVPTAAQAQKVESLASQLAEAQQNVADTLQSLANIIR